MPSKLSENAGLLQVLLPLRSSTLAKVSKLAIELHQAVHVMPELWCLTVWNLREDTGCGVVCLNDDMLVELSGVHAKRGVESISLMVIEVHGDIDRQAEKLAPLAGLPVIGHGWLCLQDCSEEITMPVLVLAPVLKVLKHGIQLAIWVALQVSVDADVPPVANLL